jgi:uncharacterized delta-60 repeat protein
MHLSFRARIAASAIVPALALGALASAPRAAAATTPSSLDPAFASGGLADIDLGVNLDRAQAVASGPNHTVVAAGGAADAASNHRLLGVSRYLADGHPDKTFGSGGGVVVPVHGTDDVWVNAVVVQSDGSVVVGGQSGPDPETHHPFIARISPAGQLDSAFGTGGILVPDVIGTDIRDLVVQPDANLLAMTAGFDQVIGAAITVLRFLPTGAPDNTWGVGGKVVVPCTSSCPAVRMAVYPDGGLVVGGGGPAINHNFFATRLTSLGAVVPSFGAQGFVQGDELSGRDIVVQPDGKIVLAGGTVRPDLAFVRLNADGARDDTFGTNGVVVNAIEGDVTDALALELDPAGKLVVAVSQGLAGGLQFVGRYGADGAPDTSFGSVGHALLPLGSDTQALALDGDKPVVAGTFGQNSFAAVVTSAGAVAWHTVENLGKGDSDVGDAVAEQADNKLLVASRHDTDNATVSRLNSDGTLDPTFGVAGDALLDPTPWPHHSSVAGLVVQSDGKILAALNWADSANDPSRGIVLVRLLTDGTIDQSFGSSGLALLDNGAAPFNEAAGFVARPGGGVAVFGTRGSDAQRDLLIKARQADGTADAAFGSNGEVVLDGGFGTNDTAGDIAVGPDGSIFISSTAVQSATNHVQVRRYTAAGTLVTAFGASGVAQDRAAGVLLAVQPDGRVVTAGKNANKVLFSRLKADGSQDTVFGGAGIVNAPFEDTQQVSAAKLVLQRGMPTVVGRADGVMRNGSLSQGSGLALARVTPDGRLDATVGGDGTATTLLPSNKSIDVVDGMVDTAGRVVAVGGASTSGPNATSNTFLARTTPTPQPADVGGFVVDAFAGLHQWGGRVLPAAPTAIAGSTRARGLVTLPDHTGGYVLDANGSLKPFAVGPSAMPAAAVTPDTYGTADVARGVVLFPNGQGGYVLDSAGGLHRFAVGTNPLPAAARLTFYSANRARGLFLLPDGTSGYVLDANGTLHAFAVGDNSMPAVAYTPDTYGTADVARGAAVLPGGRTGYVLDNAGGLHRFAVGTNPLPSTPTITFYRGNSARGLSVLADGSGGYVLDAAGRLNPFAVGTNPLPAWVYTPDVWPADLARGMATL